MNAIYITSLKQISYNDEYFLGESNEETVPTTRETRKRKASENLETPSKRSTRGSRPCSKCSKVYGNIWLHEKSCGSATKDSPSKNQMVACKKCNLKFKSNGIHTHERYCDGTVKASLICHVCTSDFSKDRSHRRAFVFQKHVERCERFSHFIDGLKCKVCDREFQKYALAIKHAESQSCVVENKDILVCKFCDQDFTHEHKSTKNDYYNRHVYKCEKYHKFVINYDTCSFCKRTFQLSYGNVLSHVEKCPENPESTANESVSTLKPCFKCARMFAKYGLATHEKNCGSDPQRQEKICQSCHTDFTYDRNVHYKPEAFERHVTLCSLHNKNVIDFKKCNFCSKVCSTHSHALQHVGNCQQNPDCVIEEDEKKEDQICPTCSKEFNKLREVDFDKHKEKCEKWNQHVDNLTCKLCQASFDSIGHLLNHLDKQYCQKPQNSPCPSCQREFPKLHRTAFEKHVERCSMWNQYVENDGKTCKKCNATFDNNGFVLLHLEKEICTAPPKRRCDVCKIDYSNKLRDVEFERHTKICEKWFDKVLNYDRCRLCNKTFKTLGHVLLHLKSKYFKDILIIKVITFLHFFPF